MVVIRCPFFITSLRTEMIQLHSTQLGAHSSQLETREKRAAMKVGERFLMDGT